MKFSAVKQQFPITFQTILFSDCLVGLLYFSLWAILGELFLKIYYRFIQKFFIILEQLSISKSTPWKMKICSKLVGPRNIFLVPGFATL